MPRTARVFVEGAAYHVLNRGNNRAEIFHKPQDYQAFMSMMRDAQARAPATILAYCLMPNHWHIVFYPTNAVEISSYMRLLMNVHVRRHHQHYGTTGYGHLYQGRYKSFVVQSDRHLLHVLRYVEANALRAGIVDDVRLWPWGSLVGVDRPHLGAEVTSPPVSVPDNWIDYVNTPVPDDDVRQIRHCIRRGSPYGESDWAIGIANTHGLGFTLRPRGRPRNGDTHLFTETEKR